MAFECARDDALVRGVHLAHLLEMRRVIEQLVLLHTATEVRPVLQRVGLHDPLREDRRQAILLGRADTAWFGRRRRARRGRWGRRRRRHRGGGRCGLALAPPGRHRCAEAVASASRRETPGA
eukprot:3689431-Pyramimonas_sp.AAC.1